MNLALFYTWLRKNGLSKMEQNVFQQNSGVDVHMAGEGLLCNFLLIWILRLLMA